MYSNGPRTNPRSFEEEDEEDVYMGADDPRVGKNNWVCQRCGRGPFDNGPNDCTADDKDGKCIDIFYKKNANTRAFGKRGYTLGRCHKGANLKVRFVDDIDTSLYETGGGNPKKAYVFTVTKDGETKHFVSKVEGPMIPPLEGVITGFSSEESEMAGGKTVYLSSNDRFVNPPLEILSKPDYDVILRHAGITAGEAVMEAEEAEEEVEAAAREAEAGAEAEVAFFNEAVLARKQAVAAEKEQKLAEKEQKLAETAEANAIKEQRRLKKLLKEAEEARDAKKEEIALAEAQAAQAAQEALAEAQAAQEAVMMALEKGDEDGENVEEPADDGEDVEDLWAGEEDYDAGQQEQQQQQADDGEDVEDLWPGEEDYDAVQQEEPPVDEELEAYLRKEPDLVPYRQWIDVEWNEAHDLPRHLVVLYKPTADIDIGRLKQMYLQDEFMMTTGMPGYEDRDFRFLVQPPQRYLQTLQKEEDKAKAKMERLRLQRAKREAKAAADAEKREERQRTKQQRVAAKAADEARRRQDKIRSREEAEEAKRLAREATREAKRQRREANAAARVGRPASTGGTSAQDALVGPSSLVGLPWNMPFVPSGRLRHHNDSRDRFGLPILYSEIPVVLRQALEDWIESLRQHDKPKVAEQDMYWHVTPQSGWRDEAGNKIYRGWQVQKSYGGALVRFPVVMESILGAFMIAASIVDPRLRSMDSMKAWILWLMDDAQHAVRWLSEVQQDLEKEVTMPATRHGRPTRADAVSDDDDLGPLEAGGVEEGLGGPLGPLQAGGVEEGLGGPLGPLEAGGVEEHAPTGDFVGGALGLGTAMVDAATAPYAMLDPVALEQPLAEEQMLGDIPTPDGLPTLDDDPTVGGVTPLTTGDLDYFA